MAILADTKEKSLDDYYVKNPGAESAPAPAPITPGQATATGYTAERGMVNEEETSSGRMNKITGQDSPLMQRASGEGVLMAASRGLGNSSISAGTSMGAMADKATPLALKDAEVFQNQNIENQRATNRASEVTTGRETDVDVSNVAQENDVRKFNVDQAGVADRFNTGEANSMTKQVLDANAGVNIQGLVGDQAMDIQEFSDATKLSIANTQAGQAAYSTYTSALTSIMQNADKMRPEALQKAIDMLNNNLESTVSFSDGMAELDFGDILGDTQADATTVTNTAVSPAVKAAPYVSPQRRAAWRNDGTTPDWAKALGY